MSVLATHVILSKISQRGPAVRYDDEPRLMRDDYDAMYWRIATPLKMPSMPAMAIV